MRNEMVVLHLTEEDIGRLQRLFYSTVPADQRGMRRHPTEMSPVRVQNADGTLGEEHLRLMTMDERIPDETLRELWIRIDSQCEEQHPFSVL